jgi:hypothetical protein
MTVGVVTVANDPGLDFHTEASALGSGPNTFTITYSITAPASDPMTDASLAISGGVFGSEPTSSFQVSETLSNGKSLSASNSQLNASTTFAPTTSLTVTDTATVTLANFNDLKNQFSETPVTAPEPSSLALLGVGLSALGFVRRRKRS